MNPLAAARADRVGDRPGDRRVATFAGLLAAPFAGHRFGRRRLARGGGDGPGVTHTARQEAIERAVADGQRVTAEAQCVTWGLVVEAFVAGVGMAPRPRVSRLHARRRSLPPPGIPGSPPATHIPGMRPISTAGFAVAMRLAVPPLRTAREEVEVLISGAPTPGQRRHAGRSTAGGHGWPPSDRPGSGTGRDR